MIFTLQRRLMMRRSFSEGDSRALCRCRQHDGPQTAPLIQTDNQFKSFPSLTNDRLQESGIANLPDTEMYNRWVKATHMTLDRMMISFHRAMILICRENLSEFELQVTKRALHMKINFSRITLTNYLSWNSHCSLQKRYTAFSLCLCTDRVTLPQRMELSLRQRDQSERNLVCEVQKMQQDIQASEHSDE